MPLEKRGKVYSLRLHRGGHQLRISTGAGNLRDAKRAAERITAMLDREKQTKQLTAKLCEYAVALARGELTRRMIDAPLRALEAQAALEVLPVIAELFPAPPLTAAELWSRYIETRPEVKPVTLRTRRQRYATFERWAGERDMADLTLPECRRFIASLGHPSGQTVKNYVSDISVVFDAAEITPNPWKSPNLKPKHVEHAETAAMEIEPARQLLAYCDERPAEIVGDVPLLRWAAFFRAMYYSGQRIVDVCFFERREFDGIVIDMMPEKTSRSRRWVNYKADPQLRELLQSLPETDERYFFPEFAAMYRRTRGRPGQLYKRIAAAAGIDPCLKLYSFRHGFATFQYTAGADENNVAAAVGHVSAKTTKKYYCHGKKTVELLALPKI